MEADTHAGAVDIGGGANVGAGAQQVAAGVGDVGGTVVDELLAHWDRYEPAPPS